jgi:hypothetical protein
MDSILESLYFLPYIIRTNTNLGLLGGTPYDIPIERSTAPGAFRVQTSPVTVLGMWLWKDLRRFTRQIWVKCSRIRATKS